ncbi:MAG: PDZ domain-containing protein [Planctomycetes bacterium]|nr:PDZ domain-containing protein [Planctomycetota bacterium]
MLVSALLSASLALLAPSTDGDVLVIDVAAHEMRLPDALRVTLSGALRLEVDEEGHSLVRLPDDARLLVDGESVEGRAELHAGDTAVILSEEGPLTITVAAPLRGGVPGPFVGSIGIGAGSGGGGSSGGLARVGPNPSDPFGGPIGVGFGSGGLFSGPPPVVLGVTTTPPGEALAAQLGLDPEHSLVVVQVPEGLPAAAAGVLEHDVIVSLDGQPVPSSGLREALAGRKAGDTLTLGVLRAGESLDLEVTLAARSDNAREALAADAFKRRFDPEELGRFLEQGSLRADVDSSLAGLATGLAERRALIDQLSAQLATEQATQAQMAARQAELKARLSGLAGEGASKSSDERRELEAALVQESQRYQQLLEQLVDTESALTDARDALAERSQGLAARQVDLGQAKAALERFYAQQSADRARELAIVGQGDGQRALLLSRDLAERARAEAEATMQRNAEQFMLQARAGRRDGPDAEEHERAAAARDAAQAAADEARAVADEMRSRADSSAERLDGIEQRLARIEASLEKLLAAKPH